MTNLLPSTEKEYKDKIRQLQIEKEAIGGIILHEVTGIINRSKDLSEEQKTKLLTALWKGRALQHEPKKEMEDGNV